MLPSTLRRRRVALLTALARRRGWRPVAVSTPGLSPAPTGRSFGDPSLHNIVFARDDYEIVVYTASCCHTLTHRRGTAFKTVHATTTRQHRNVTLERYHHTPRMAVLAAVFAADADRLAAMTAAATHRYLPDMPGRTVRDL